jgi:hypothetical protein
MIAQGAVAEVTQAYGPPTATIPVEVLFNNNYMRGLKKLWGRDRQDFEWQSTQMHLKQAHMFNLWRNKKNNK